MIAAKISDFYHIRIFDSDGNMVIDKGENAFVPNETLVQQLEAAFGSPSIDNQTQSELIQKIASSLGLTQFDGDRLLYTAHYPPHYTAHDPDPFDPKNKHCGLLLDEWTEVIPTPEETTGITFNYDRPNAEPPQTMLLVTSPHMDGAWQWDDLVDAIRETLEEARLRAVEPTQVDDTPYARFLPATISAATLHPITIMLNFALNNNVYRLINTEEDA